MEPESQIDRLAFAKSYPFPLPRRSYIYVNGAHYELEDHGPCPLRAGRIRVAGRLVPTADHLARLGVETGPGLEGRVPAIACGANQSPAHLKRKFVGFPGDTVIPVSRASLDDFDVVYSCHITRYGSIPAMLQHVPETRVALAVNWLTPAQLARMHPTEVAGSSYAYARLEGIRLALDGGRKLVAAFAYVGLCGCFAHDGAAIGLAAVAADHRQLKAMSQVQVQRLARDRAAPGIALDDFIQGNIADPGLRAERMARLEASALPFAWPHVKMVETSI